MPRHILFLFLLVLFSSAPVLPSFAMPPLDPETWPAAPDYAQSQSWLVKPASIAARVDVFFVYPTVMFNDTDWVMDINRADLRSAALDTVRTQASVFKGLANLYAPMYRQMNLAGLGLSDTDAAPLQEVVHGDVWRAFSHYLTHENNGRPFFLAGHSQGSMILSDLLLKHWGTTGTEDLLVAALLPGWSLTPEDLAAHDQVRMCRRPDQTGCIISYNTMAAGRQSAAPTLKQGAVAVNPLSWSTDGTFVPADNNLGSVFFDENGDPVVYPHFTSAQVVDGGLIVDPGDVKLVTVEGGHFPEGVYHAFDYSLFYENLRENIERRLDAFNR